MLHFYIINIFVADYAFVKIVNIIKYMYKIQ